MSSEDMGGVHPGRRKPGDTVARKKTNRASNKTEAEPGSDARRSLPPPRFNELDSLRIQTDAYEEELEEFKKILGDDFVAQESFRGEAGPSDAPAQPVDRVCAGIQNDMNAYLRHGTRRFGSERSLEEDESEQVDAVLAEDAAVAVGDGAGATGHGGGEFMQQLSASRPKAALSQFFADLDPERENIARAVERNLQLQKRMELLLASNDASLKECDALLVRIDGVDREKRQRIKDLEHGSWRAALVQSSMEFAGGQSWFFKGATYVGTEGFIDVANHLALASRSGEWSQEERDGLVRGMKEMAQERRALELMDRVEFIEDFLALQRDSDVRDLESSPPTTNRGGTADGADVADAANRPGQSDLPGMMTEEEWNLIAWRHVPKRTGKECMLQWRNATKSSLKMGPFDEDEAKKLAQLVKRHGNHGEAWEIIAHSLPGRTPLACLKEFTREGRVEEARAREKERRFGNLCFTEDDVKRVRELVLKHGQSWKKIAKEFGGSWTPQQIMFEWRKHLQSTGGGVVVAKKGKWSKDEDDKLVKAVAVLGRQWAKVAQHVPGRTEMQVRERYVNHLDPEVESNQPFTDAELELVKREVPNHTNPKSGRISWAKVARMLPSRTDRQVKKAWERLSRVSTRQKKGRVKRKRKPWDDADDD